MNAINDILNNDRWLGTLDSISGLISIVDQAFVVVISFVAFFIIFGAFLKNTIAGAYAVNPKLFDKVHEFKEQGKERAKGARSKEFGIAATIFFTLIPNFKELTPFTDDTVEPKDYFVKAIPQMFLSVMIGITIYNGYTRDLMVTTGIFTATLFERSLSAVDPVQIIDEMLNWTTNPVFAAKGEDTDIGKSTLDISKDVFFAVTGYYKDLKDSESAKSNLAADVENYVRDLLIGLDAESGFLDSDKYKLTYTVDREYQYTDLSNQNYETETMISRAYSIDTIKQFGVSSLQHQDNPLFIRLILRFEKKAEGVKTYTFNDLTLVVPIGSYTTGPLDTNNGGSVTGINFKLNGDAELSTSSSTNTSKFTYKQIPYNLQIQSNTVFMYSQSTTIDPTKFGDDTLSIGNDGSAPSLFYKLDGKSYKVTSIRFTTDASKGIYFTNEAGTVKDFTFGDKPTPIEE